MTVGSEIYILVINCGSSSLKFSLYEFSDAGLNLSGTISGIGESGSQFKITDQVEKVISDQPANYGDMHTASGAVIQWLQSQPYRIGAIGHRLVQGGPNHRDPELITDELLKQINEFIYLAPNHLPDELRTIEAFRSAFPEIPQAACFDTNFHKDMPAYVQHYPLPAAYQKEGMIKYGFHGLSYAYILQKLAQEDPEIINKNIIIAHLGNGASMAAVKHGTSLDTTMGLSPIGGLVMSTRSGDLDPGVILFLLKQYKLSVDELDELLSKRSGMIAIAGTGDMEELLVKEATDSKAAAAIQVFCYQVKKQIGALAAALGGLDMLVFTGGIGANSPRIREYVCRDLNFLGIELNLKANYNSEEIISLNTGRVSVRALTTHEDLMIAQAVREVLNQSIKH